MLPEGEQPASSRLWARQLLTLDPEALAELQRVGLAALGCNPEDCGTTFARADQELPRQGI